MKIQWKLNAFVALAALLLVACGGAAPEPATSPPEAAASAESVGTTPPDAVVTETPTDSASGNNSQPEVTTSTSSPSLQALAESASANAPKGGKLIQLGSDPPTLDPHKTTDNVSGFFVNEVYGGLVTLDLDLNVVPDLAESWEISQDGRTYTFFLRPDAKFHNGKPVTADDVKWSLERVADPETLSVVVDQYLADIVGVKDKLSGAASSVGGVRVIDKHTVAITIDEPKSYFLSKLTYPTGFVLDRENVEGSENWLREPNGTGPFRLAEYETGEILRLTRNENYHLGPPNLDEVEFILAGGQGMLMYESDEVHLTGVGRADLARVLDLNEPLNAEVVAAPPAFSVGYIGMNVSEPPFDDPKVRLALNYAIDKATIAEVVLEGLRIPAQGVIPPGFPSYNSDLRSYTYDPGAGPPVAPGSPSTGITWTPYPASH